jgi:2',3'-cyclic-nucleotide 2'-phosphodiesterase (5'-nucleotidase family)
MPIGVRGVAMRTILVMLVLALALTGCQQAPTPTSAVAQPTIAPSPTLESPTATAVPPTPTQSSSATPQPALEPTSPNRREVVVIQTNDEHGYLLPTESQDFVEGGAAYCAASWVSKGYDPNATKGNTLLISGGDNWTGQAISSWFHGESTIEVMNTLGYKASVTGNHEFDAGQEVLRERTRQAKFPYLAANLYRKGTEEVSDLVKPYTFVEVNGVKVGIIGLAMKETPDSTASKHLQGLAFGDYEPALRRWVPVVRKQGAQVVIVESHICPQVLSLLAEKVQDLGIALFGGGHCHMSSFSSAGGAVVAVASANWNDYVLTRLVYDTEKGKVVESKQELVNVLFPQSANPKPKPDPFAERVIEKWEQRTKLVLGEVIGYTKAGLGRDSAAMHNLLVDCWLWAYPEADVAMSNLGGFREGIAPGDITVGDIVSVFPFDNELYELKVKGKEILQAMATSGEALALGGIRRKAEGEYVLARDGTPLKPDAAYRLLVTDYMYGNSKYPFSRFDKRPYETSILWRQPVIDWIRAQKSNKDNPLESHVDNKPRG